MSPIRARELLISAAAWMGAFAAACTPSVTREGRIGNPSLALAPGYQFLTRKPEALVSMNCDGATHYLVQTHEGKFTSEYRPEAAVGDWRPYVSELPVVLREGVNRFSVWFKHRNSEQVTESARRLVFNRASELLLRNP